MITTYSYDAANQLVAEESASSTITYTYDPNGNMTVRNDGGARTTYTWDAENRLVGVDLAAGGPVTMTYDAEGLRRRLQTPSEDTRYVWDDQNVLLETDDQGATQASYTLAPRRYGDLLSQRRGSDSRFYLFDGLGSTDRLLDEDEAATDSYTYEAFGTARASTGTTPNPYRYVGRLGYQFHGATELHYIRARHYDAAIGAFTSRDPDWPQQAAYAYARNTAPRATDPTGLAVPPTDPASGCYTEQYSQEMCNTEWGDIQAKLGQVFKRAFPNGPDRGNGRLLFYGLACLTWGESECDPACLTYPNPGSEAGNAWGWYQFIAEDWKQALQGAAAHTVDNSFLDWNKQKACKCHRGINTRAALSLVWQECSDHDTIFDALHRWDVARLPNIEPRKRWEQCLASKNITVQDLKAHACPQANAVLA